MAERSTRRAVLAGACMAAFAGLAELMKLAYIGMKEYEDMKRPELSKTFRAINEAAMTGESRPIAKGRGDTVLSGTLVEEGRLRVYAEHVGHKTAAARIAEYVEQSLNAKSEAQLKASQLADRLVPAVLGLAGAFAAVLLWMRRRATTTPPARFLLVPAQREGVAQ